MTTSSPFTIEMTRDAVSPATEVVWLTVDEDRARERKKAQLLDRHWTMLGVSVAVVVLAFALQLNSAGRVSASWLPLESLPPLCGSRAFFGINCPGCGLTRSFVALAAGDVAESIRLHRVGWMLAMAVVLQIPYRLWGLLEIRRGVLSDRVWPAWCGHALIAALLLNWLFNLAVGA
jgi:hypothetical protein